MFFHFQYVFFVLLVLDSMVEPLQKTLNYKPKQDAVKQEVDRNEDMIRSALRAISSLSRIRLWSISSHNYIACISCCVIGINLFLFFCICVSVAVSAATSSRASLVIFPSLKLCGKSIVWSGTSDDDMIIPVGFGWVGSLFRFIYTCCICWNLLRICYLLWNL